MSPIPAAPSSTNRVAEVFATALRLGLTSFGGPIAHLGYFERTYVRERGWLTQGEFGELLALCQVIPGPASSQLGFLIGLHRAGYRGALAAWLGFTLPSAVVLFVAALLAAQWQGTVASAVLHGLKLASVAVVAQAAWNMGRRLWTDWSTAAIGACAAVGVLSGATGTGQALWIVVGAAAGAMLCRRAAVPAAASSTAVSQSVAWCSVSLFAALLLGLPLLASRFPYGPVALASTFYESGALVFGGGHVVLPLLHGALVPTGWLNDDAFLAGYGFAQAMPGPLFTVAAYFAAVNQHVGPPIVAAGIALLSIFLPGLLLALGALALWRRMASHVALRGALVGINAAVVGLLIAALYDPVWKSSIRSMADIALATAGFLLLERWKQPPFLVVALCVAGGLAQAGWR